MNDVMLDTETLGRRAGCVVLSIGAAQFDPRGSGYGMTFSKNIDVQSSRGYGLVEEPETVSWWASQSPEAKALLFLPAPEPLHNVLYSFSHWFEAVGGEKIWSQGAAFDFPILTELYRRIGIEPPWKFWNVRDTRTAYDLCGFDKESIKRTGTYHNALDDAVHQITCVQSAMSFRASAAGKQQ